MNSMKMKISVILGVIQMLFGIVLKGMNAFYFKAPLDLIFEFIPQIIFMVILFGYMIVMIFMKWATDWSGDTSRAPSIITQLMSIFLNGGSVGPEGVIIFLFYFFIFLFSINFLYGVEKIIHNKKTSIFML
jgi:V-type H+-transporting ATPase subunit a